MKKYNTIQEIIQKGLELKNKDIEELIEDDHHNKNNKGLVGQLVETHFGLPNSNLSESDFKVLGIDAELKTTPIKISNKKFVAKERLVLGMIDYFEDYKEEEFEKSRIFEKIKNTVIVNYLVNVDKRTFLDTWEMNFSEEEVEIIKTDYKTVVNKIKNGKAHELSDSDTTFLSACRKGHNEKDVNQPFSNLKASKRAWSFKTGFMTRKTQEHYYKTIEKISIFGKEALANAIEMALSKYKGKTANEIFLSLGAKSQKNKAKNSNAINLVLKSAKISQSLLSSYDLIFKTMILNKSGFLQESMSFSQIDFDSLNEMDFEDSEIYQYLSNGAIINLFDHSDRYLKTVYVKFNKKEIEDAHRVFLKLKDSLKTTLIYRPKIKENLTIHMRPKGINANDTIKIKTGEIITKQTLWINREVINNKIK